MSLHFYSLDRCVAKPWKNGGGSTREIVCWPINTSMSDFDWRISVADIDADGPFSAFPGLDRTILLLNGAGVQLSATDGSFNHRLSEALAPFNFSGDTSVNSVLLDGKTQDLNIMVRRNKWEAITDIVKTKTHYITKNYGLIYVAAGQFDVTLCNPNESTGTDFVIRAGEGFWWDKLKLKLSLTPSEENSALVLTQLLESR